MIDRWLLLAQRTLHGPPPASWHRIREHWHFSGEGLMATTPVVILMALLCLALALVSHRHTRWRPQRSARRKVFCQIISGTGLGKTEQHLLTRIARQQRLATPLTLVLSQATFDYHVRRYVQKVRPRHTATVDACAARIRRVVFGVAQGQQTDRPPANQPPPQPG